MSLHSLLYLRSNYGLQSGASVLEPVGALRHSASLNLSRPQDAAVQNGTGYVQGAHIAYELVQGALVRSHLSGDQEISWQFISTQSEDTRYTNQLVSANHSGLSLEACLTPSLAGSRLQRKRRNGGRMLMHEYSSVWLHQCCMCRTCYFFNCTKRSIMSF